MSGIDSVESEADASMRVRLYVCRARRRRRGGVRGRERRGGLGLPRKEGMIMIDNTSYFFCAWFYCSPESADSRGTWRGEIYQTMRFVWDSYIQQSQKQRQQQQQQHIGRRNTRNKRVEVVAEAEAVAVATAVGDRRRRSISSRIVYRISVACGGEKSKVIPGHIYERLIDSSTDVLWL